MKILTSCCFITVFTLGLNLPAETAHAQASSYKVEVVLFKHLSEQGKNSEYWIKPEHLKVNSSSYSLLDNSLPDSSASQQHNDNMQAQREYLPGTDIQPALARYDMESRTFSPLRNGLNGLSSSQYRLANSAALIQQSKHFQLLAHFGWTQPRLSENRALPILMTRDPLNEGLPEGEIRLHVSRYLHINVDLAQSECVPTQQKTVPAGYQSSSTAADSRTYTGLTSECIEHTYQFKQHRKMRSKELHYLDNPVFGMLVYITPI